MALFTFSYFVIPSLLNLVAFQLAMAISKSLLKTFLWYLGHRGEGLALSYGTPRGKHSVGYILQVRPWVNMMIGGLIELHPLSMFHVVHDVLRQDDTDAH